MEEPEGITGLSMILFLEVADRVSKESSDENLGKTSEGSVEEFSEEAFTGPTIRALEEFSGETPKELLEQFSNTLRHFRRNWWKNFRMYSCRKSRWDFYKHFRRDFCLNFPNDFQKYRINF